MLQCAWKRQSTCEVSGEGLQASKVIIIMYKIITWENTEKNICKQLCLFCEKPMKKEDYKYVASTFDTYFHVRKCATDLSDSKLLTNLPQVIWLL